MGSFAANIESKFNDAMMAAPDAAPASPAPAASAPAPAAAEPAAAPPPVASPAPPVATPPAADAPPPTSEPEEEEEFKFPDEVAAPPKPEAKEKDEDDPFGGKPPSDAEQAAVSKWLKTPKGRLALGQFKVARELEKPPAEGGLGFIPNAEQTKEAFGHSGHLRTMAQQFHSGDPNAAQNFIAQWFLPQPGAQLSKGAVEVAKQFLPMLAEQFNTSPAARDLYIAAVRPGVENYIDELYREAASMPTPEERIQWFNAARFAESHLNGGKYRDIPDELVKSGKDPNAPDPKAVEINQKLQRIESFEQQQVRNQQDQFARSLHSATETPLMTDIDAALAPIKEQFSDRAYKAIVKEFHAEVVSKVRANPANLRAYTEARDTARQNPTRENIEKAGKAWAEAARSTIRSLRPTYINDALKPKVAESADRHKTLEEASQKRGAPSVAAPVGKDLAAGPNGPQRLPDGSLESHREALERKFQAVLSA